MNRMTLIALAAVSTMLVSGAQSSEPAAALAAAAGVATHAATAAFDDPEGFGAEDVARFLRSARTTTLSERDVSRISNAVVRYSAKYGLDPLLVTQVLWVESGARPWVRSPLGAIGLMQVMPTSARPLGLAGNLTTIEGNVEAGCAILADNIRRLGEEDGISAYFWGSNIRSVAYLDRVRRARATVRGASES
jgi:soluble lytic murein transglycosylase-like protein